MYWQANDKYVAQLRSTWIADPADGTLSVDSVPENVPTVVVVGYDTDYETVFSVTGKSGDNSSNYTLTGVERLRGANQNLQTNSTVNCLNNEEFFNQYQTTSVNDWYDLTFATTLAIDITNSAKQRLTLTGNITSMTLTGTLPGQVFMIRLKQDTTGSRTVTWFSGISWLTDDELNATASAETAYIFIRTGTSTYDGFRIGETQEE
jgi:hypothetical protein